MVENHQLLLDLPVVFDGSIILFRGRTNNVFQIGRKLSDRDRLDLRNHRSDGRAVVGGNHDKVVPLQREIRRMERVDLSLFLEFNAYNILQVWSLLALIFFRQA